MRIQDTDTVGGKETSPQKKGNAWGRGTSAIIIVALIIGTAVLVFTQVGRHAGKNTQQNTQQPIHVQWVEVLNGYTVTSLVAAPSNPSVLYACANRAGYTLLRSTDG